MNAPSLTADIVESVTSDGKRCLQIEMPAGRTVFAVEWPYPEILARPPFWVVSHQPWCEPSGSFCVDTEDYARAAVMMIAAAAAMAAVA